LASIQTEGLGIPPLRAAYLVQYRGGLISQQLKALMPTMVFVIHDLAPNDIMDVWKVAGKVAALLWFPEIDELDAYLEELCNEIGILLDAMAIIDPTHIIQKSKFHILLHIVEDMCHFSPAILFSTE
ncbi:hypothetical protein M422DRAFT_82460, partial [Sphaerobolus stellatus SS14]